MTGNQIRKLRERLDLDPVLFSRLLGVHLSTVYRWEQSKKSPRIDIMQKQLLEYIDKHWYSTGEVDSQLENLQVAIARHPLEGLRALLFERP